MSLSGPLSPVRGEQALLKRSLSLPRGFPWRSSLLLYHPTPNWLLLKGSSLSFSWVYISQLFLKRRISTQEQSRLERSQMASERTMTLESDQIITAFDLPGTLYLRSLEPSPWPWHWWWWEGPMTSLHGPLGSLEAHEEKYKRFLALIFPCSIPYFSSVLPLVPAHLPTTTSLPLELSSTPQALLE